MNVAEKLKEYAELEQQKAIQKEALRMTNIQIASLEQKIIGDMAEAGLNKISLEGGRTYSVRRFLSASPAQGVERGDIGDALIQSGYAALVRADYNTQTFSALIREYESKLNGGRGGASPEEVIAALPEQLRPLVKVSETYALSSLKAA